MTAQISFKGTLTTGGNCPAACSSAGDSTVRRLMSRCSPSYYQSAVDTPIPLVISTQGLPGTTFVDLDLLDSLTAIEFLYVKSDARIVLRIGAAEAVLSGTSATFPTGFVGGETLIANFDGTQVTTTFQVGDQLAAACAARINAACALAGLSTPRATVNNSTGQLELRGTQTGTTAFVQVTGGTGATVLGFGGTPIARGAGADIPVYGTFLIEFPAYQDAPSRIQVSGQATILLEAAGRTT